MVYYCCVWRWKEEIVGRAHDLPEVIHLFCRLLRDPTVFNARSQVSINKR
ncbi:hypothetical protein BDP81DRAFT_425013 [Colletotrichum phormii]|uniref:Uncharacterized protein n=1 Tax=Colletotrichum phormii TaxID=359342 RepID=A0AAJ0EGY2_9PEZI|nr:uncharacterized protein BDP81DRAFT_425013 [Colletotrichum phormii]KAK1638454.1 hypothetical protein BDP81DRAFT_425013 [Colletotrichum phormii]